VASYNELESMGHIHETQKTTAMGEDQEVLPNVHRISALLKSMDA